MSEAGKKYDGAKIRPDLLPDSALREVLEVLTFGAEKYGPDNWRRVEDLRGRYMNAARRHLLDYRQGERMDPESKFHHLAHAIASIAFVLADEIENP